MDQNILLIYMFYNLTGSIYKERDFIFIKGHIRNCYLKFLVHDQELIYEGATCFMEGSNASQN